MRHKIFHIVPGLLFCLLLISPIFYFMVNIGNYFDPINFCYINIEGDILRGNSHTIQQVIKNIRKNDTETYKTLCAYVHTIHEEYCLGSDWSLDKTYRGLDTPGCYIKGSKVIYLTPNSKEDGATIEKRYQALIKYAKYSKEFWESLDSKSIDNQL